MKNIKGVSGNCETKGNDDPTPSLSNPTVFYPGNFPPQINLQPFPMYFNYSFV